VTSLTRYEVATPLQLTAVQDTEQGAIQLKAMQDTEQGTFAIQLN
jgi:hypothetical protein